ncbi:MAG: 23S rRNA (adenine(2030)-N(6))-methyltransferase RlmJ [Treponema sp.]|nr:23S rRNA (adenine(2030)-N(6))-methyltransferase RlmJ [Candidatus Treponema equifaecale]
MLSYIHAYHAGNHADILKHITISLIMEALCKKEKPFTVFDTHSASGLYDLADSRLEKTGEAETGIFKLKEKIEMVVSTGSTDAGTGSADANTVSNDAEKWNPAKNYFSIVSEYLQHNQYPGSPLIENHFLREGDVQILSELHPAVFEELVQNTKKCRIQPQLHKRNGYEMLSALTPPQIKRGLAVIDPSFEDAEDFEKCGKIISQVHKKWPVGIIALWYPLVSHRTMEISQMKEMIASSVTSDEPKILDVQLLVKKPEEMTGLASLYGSGMYILNFPYQLDTQLESILPELSKILSQTNSEWTVERI